MARRKKRRRRRNGTKFSLIKGGVAIAPALIAFKNSGGIEGVLGNPEQALYNTVFEYSGLSIDQGTFDSAPLVRNVTMWIGGFIASAIAQRLGINRQFSKIPIIGKYIKI